MKRFSNSIHVLESNDAAKLALWEMQKLVSDRKKCQLGLVKSLISIFTTKISFLNIT